MKLLTKLALTSLFVSFGLASASADQFGWDFGTTTPNPNFDLGIATNFTVGPMSIANSKGTVAAPINNTTPSAGYTGDFGPASAAENIGNAVNVGALDIATTAYYSFTLTPSAGLAIQLTEFDFGTRSTGTGPTTFSLYSSIDNFTTALLTATVTANSMWTFQSNAAIPLVGLPGTAVEYRLYTYGGAGSPTNNTQNNRLDDVAITAAAIPEPSVYMLLGVGLLLCGQRFLGRRKSA